MKVPKGSASERFRKMEEEFAEFERKREAARNEAAREVGALVIEAGGLDVDRSLLIEVVRKLVAGDEKEVRDALGLSHGKPTPKPVAKASGSTSAAAPKGDLLVE